MRIENLKFIAGTNTLVGTKVLPYDSATPQIMSLHGAGQSTRHRIRYLLDDLSKLGMSSFSFDFSGHGDSSGLISDSSLSLRVTEAISACKLLRLDRVSMLIGSSMGAHIASMLTKIISVDTLLLYCPAAYSRDAASVKFGSGFTEIIREPNSYRSSEVFDAICDFRGKLLIVVGSQDSVIPKEVVDQYIDSARSCAKKELLVVEGAGHDIHPWLREHSSDKATVLNMVRQLLDLHIGA